MTNPYDGPPYWTPPTYSRYDQATAAADQAARAHRRRRRIQLTLAGAAVLTAGSLGISAAVGAFDSGSSPLVATADQGNGSAGSGSSGSSGSGSSGSGNGYGYGNGYGFGNGSGSSGTSTAATDAQQVGVVDINTVLGYQSAQAAGTGMILTSTGEVLTNNHVVSGATKISVTVVSTGKTYTASVVGTDASDDVAVIQLQGASGLDTVKTADSAKVAVGDKVTGVGNAGGTGGTPSASTGTVTAIDQTITASDAGGANAETLTGLIETDADIQAGDSGGPLYNASDQVVGMDSAASSGGFSTEAYAIPIDKALSIADQIESGQSSSTVHIGQSPFLGVELQSVAGNGFGANGDQVSGATIAGVVSGSPAAQAGMAAGDTITSLGGTSIDSASTLSTAIGQHKVGDSVSIGWTDSSGQSHSATVTLIAGPAA